MHSLKPTAAAGDLKRAREALDAAKRKLAARGRYACCVKPSCNLCARVNGSCNCAANVAAGKGACGECYGGWQNGRGALKGVDPKSVALLTADRQSCPLPPNPAEIPQAALDAAADALLRAKRILVREKRFACCIRGGCGQCAHEGACRCGADLASRKKGVCGDCLDRWRAGQGAFDGIDPTEVTLALAAAAGWTIMPSGQMFGVYSDQSGARGRDKIFSTNWLMLMASHRLGPGEFMLRTMLSLEPATVTSRRYPLLFATGETAYGIPIINGQHPHDFFMELAAQYKIHIGERASIHLYGGPRGEPALGPVAYPHRASASENPVAVISHHTQDSTHISTNVATTGVSYGPITWEVSGFHGREPDEKRWGIESGAIDSLSSRLSVNSAGWAGQFSMGRINRGETVHPLRPALRTTASLSYARTLANGEWNTSLIWGRNHELEYTQLPNVPVFPIRTSGIRPLHIVSVPTRIPGQIYNSFLAETTLRWKRNWIWGRAESADKDSTLLFEEAPFVLLVDENRLARVQAYTAGYEREVPSGLRRVSTGLGGQFTLYHAPPLLAPIYGANPLGLQLFFRLRLR